MTIWVLAMWLASVSTPTFDDVELVTMFVDHGDCNKVLDKVKENDPTYTGACLPLVFGTAL